MKSISILASIGGTALTAAIAAFIATSAIAPAPADASETQAVAGSAALQPLTSQPCDSLVPPASTPRTVSYLTTNEVGITVCDPDGQGWAFNEATTGLSFVTNPGTVTSTLNYSATFDTSGPDASFDAISYAGANVYDMTTLQSYPATRSGDIGKVLQSGETAALSCSIDIPVEALSSVYLTWQVAYDTIGADSTTFRVTDGSFGPQWSFAVNAAPTEPTTPPVTPEPPVVTPAPPVVAPPAAPAPVEKPKVTG